MDMKDLPEKLKEQLGDLNPDKDYTTADYLLSFIVHIDEAMVDAMLVYLWRVTGKITIRTYVHARLKKLRDEGLIESTQYARGKSTTYRPTPAGEAAARPYVEVGA